MPIGAGDRGWVGAQRFAGENLTDIEVVADTGTYGDWSMDCPNIAIVDVDSSVSPIFTGQQISVVPLYGGNESPGLGYK